MSYLLIRMQKYSLLGMKVTKNITQLSKEHPPPHSRRVDSYLLYYLSSEFAFGSLRDVLPFISFHKK